MFSLFCNLVKKYDIMSAHFNGREGKKKYVLLLENMDLCPRLKQILKLWGGGGGGSSKETRNLTPI